MRDSGGTALSRCASCVLLALALLGISTIALQAQGKSETLGDARAATLPKGNQSPPEQHRLQPIRTGSPRETLETLLRLTGELESALQAYATRQTRANKNRLDLLGPQFRQLFDLSAVPQASRQQVAAETLLFLLDILGRVQLPPLESVPDADAFDDDKKPAQWRVPGTPIRIVRMDDGLREGEFLFSARTPAVARVFYQRVRHLPLRSSLGIDSWSRGFQQLTGPMIPAGLVAALPDVLKGGWLDTPVWKVLLVVVLVLLAGLVLVLLHRLINRREAESRLTGLGRRTLTPAAIIAAAPILTWFVGEQIAVFGAFLTVFNLVKTLVIFLAAVWLFWLVVAAIIEWMILSPRIPDESLDAELLRLIARVIGLVGGVLILALGAQALGIPALSLLAGLGIGGLAVALAIRPTLENLIGGVILYLDRPLRVGDFCTLGSHTGTVERIGVRSTQIRRIDRTLLSIPNATLADKEIVNWAQCDRMLILTTFGLRYETEPDQLRHVLVKLREMFHAHPRIEPETVRVRFAGYGASSLDIEIRVYALTREWNDFFAIREDVFLRANDIVRDAGTGFAFPSQTLYLGRDDGLDEERGAAAMQEVNAWRRSGGLPFPRLPAERIEQLEATLDYPPRGSPEAGLYGAAVPPEAAEPLATEPPLEGTGAAERLSTPETR